MGAYLSEPVLDKHSTDETSKCLSYGASSMQGWRVSQGQLDTQGHHGTQRLIDAQGKLDWHVEPT